MIRTNFYTKRFKISLVFFYVVFVTTVQLLMPSGVFSQTIECEDKIVKIKNFKRDTSFTFRNQFVKSGKIEDIKDQYHKNLFAQARADLYRGWQVWCRTKYWLRGFMRHISCAKAKCWKVTTTTPSYRYRFVPCFRPRFITQNPYPDPRISASESKTYSIAFSTTWTNRFDSKCSKFASTAPTSSTTKRSDQHSASGLPDAERWIAPTSSQKPNIRNSALYPKSQLKPVCNTNAFWNRKDLWAILQRLGSVWSCDQ